VLPVSGLSGRPAPLGEVRTALEQALRDRALEVVPREEVEAFLARNRIRWTGGLDIADARKARDELHAASILVASVDAFQAEVPPRIGIRARLVSPSARVLWSDVAVRTGDGTPGLLDLGMIDDVNVLTAQTVKALSDSLTAYLYGVKLAPACGGGTGRFGPQVTFRSRPIDGSIVILPFVNETSRRNAGDVVALEFLRQLHAAGVPVSEPGVAREQLFKFRLQTSPGVSLDTARVVMELLDADFVLAGTVRDFIDPSTSFGEPMVQFTAQLLDRKNDEIVWQSTSLHRGSDGVFFFDAGHVGSALDLSCRMVQRAVASLVDRAKPDRPAQTLRGAARH